MRRNRLGHDLVHEQPRASRFPEWLVSIFFWLLLAGCAGSIGSPADQLLRQGDYEAAVVAYQAEEAKQPDDVAVKRNFGMALVESGDTLAGVKKLQEARGLDPSDAQTLYFLGRAADRGGQIDLALESYLAYLDRSKEQAKFVQARVQALSIEKTTAEVLAAIQRESELDVADIPANSIAVADFDNAGGREDLDPLCQGLAALLVTDLGKVGRLRVLERERLHVLMNELALVEGDSPGELHAR